MPRSPKRMPANEAPEEVLEISPPGEEDENLHAKIGHENAAGGTGGAREGLSIRPQTLRLTPLYRRMRDSILRPHLRLTESRYFWEKWKPLLRPDATILIMEVRDRCNRALAGQMGHGGGPATATQEGSWATGLAEDLSADGCTVSADELAAACGFSRVTLWRLLQREDVRQFVRVEHNYIYDRRIGKKRRTVSTYHVLMEDLLVAEDEPRLQQLLAGTSPSSATNGTRHTVHSATAVFPPTFHFETEVVDNAAPRLHFETAKSGSNQKPQNVSETKLKERLGETSQMATPHAVRGGGPARLSDLLSAPALRSGLHDTEGNNLNGDRRKEIHTASAGGAAKGTRDAGSDAGISGKDVDIWKRYPEFAHYVEEAESLLGDRHSRGFYITALKRLFPGHMGAWQRALGLAREQQRITRSRGALFTRLLRTFAAEEGVSL